MPRTSSWTIHLAAQHPWRAVVALLLIVLALFAISLLAPSPIILILAGVLLLASIAEFLLPISYTLDADGAHARMLFTHRILPWKQVRRVYLDEKRIKLSPLAVRSWIENYRGVLLRVRDAEMAQATLAEIRAWLQESGATPEFVEEA